MHERERKKKATTIVVARTVHSFYANIRTIGNLARDRLVFLVLVWLAI